MDFLKRFIDKVQAFRVAKQAGKARELAELKKGARVKAARSTKEAYKPGEIGLSQVSAEIKKEHGLIMSRRDRKQAAKNSNTQFVRFYNN